jgi:FlaA1/EpsC-like NDP-sugar epimerase
LAKKLAENHGAPELPLKIIGIRQGEKLHEDMVSFEESLRCIEYEKYFLISDNILSEPVDGYTYSSNDRVLESDEVTKFLLDKGVI